MLDHLADLESDFSAIHRVDDIYQLDGPRFFRLAWRISAYKGVIHMRLQEQDMQRQAPVVSQGSATQAAPVRARPRTAGGPVPAGAQVVELSALMFTHPGLVEKRKVKSGG